MRKVFAKTLGILAAATYGLLPMLANAATASTPSTGINIPSLDNTPTDLNSIISKGVSVLLYVVGFAAVIMVIIGGFMYILSAGDSGKAAKAKDTILYAVIGIAITMLAYAIVSFVTGKLN